MPKHTNRGSLGCGIYHGEERDGTGWNLLVYRALSPHLKRFPLRVMAFLLFVDM